VRLQPPPAPPHPPTDSKPASHQTHTHTHTHTLPQVHKKCQRVSVCLLLARQDPSYRIGGTEIRRDSRVELFAVRSHTRGHRHLLIYDPQVISPRRVFSFVFSLLTPCRADNKCVAHGDRRNSRSCSRAAFRPRCARVSGSRQAAVTRDVSGVIDGRLDTF